MKTGLLTGRDTATKISAIILAAVFISLIAIQAHVFWKSIQQTETPPATEQAPVHQVAHDTPDIGRLAASHLFGGPEKNTVQPREIKEDRSLNLTLRGIVANSGGNTSLAIIESKPGGEESFALGDTVFNKGQLHSIAVDHVILMRNDGRLVRLQLPEQESIDRENENYLPQTSNVEPETTPAPEQSSDSNAAPVPAAAAGTGAATQDVPEQQNRDDTQPESSSETTPGASAGGNEETSPAQP